MRGNLGLAALVVTSLVLSAPATAAAAPLADPAPWVLPVNAFARARVGDWTILEGETLLNGKLVRQREIIRVASLSRGVAEVQLFEGAAGQEGWFLSFPVDVKRGPDTNLLFDVPWIATDMTYAKATCTLGDASFPCFKVSYRTRIHKVTAYMAQRVKGSGLVSFEVVRDGKPIWTMKTIGYGTASKVEWGAGPPRADLQGNWDGGATAVTMREGSEPATEDEYEPEPLSMPPRADLASCTILGDIDQAMLRRYVLRKLVAVEDCYLAAAGRDKKIGGGAAEVSFAVDELSAVVDVTATGSAAPALRACATDAIASLQFPFSDARARTEVTCTITFDPGKPAPPRKGPRKLLRKGHPARGGPDLRGLPRIP